TELAQPKQCSSSIVSVGNSAGQIGPSPTACGGVGIRMLRSILLAKQPIPGRVVRKLRKRIDGQRREPGCEVRVDRPTAVGPLRRLQEFHATPCHWMIDLAASCQAHHYKARQWRRFEKTTVGWLQLVQDPERALARGHADESGEGV